MAAPVPEDKQSVETVYEEIGEDQRKILQSNIMQY